jgi:F-type H+-transporting ATPase subunit beta
MEGKILQILGPVVDVEFEGQIPAINDALTVTATINGKERTIFLEVAAQIGDNVVRTIALDQTDGLVRNMKVVHTSIGDVFKGCKIPLSLSKGIFPA